MSNNNNQKSPFIGLRSFKNSDDYLPFKQESQVEDILEILQSNNLVTITGEAHSGKTSLINSGLIPRLKTGFPGQVGRNWSIVKFRPGVNPIENFCYSLSNTASLYLNSKPKDYPKGSQDQDIFRYLEPHFYPRIKVDYDNKMAYR